MRLCERILRSGEGVLSNAYQMAYFPGDVLFAANRPRGLPIGNLTSQFWANVYMHPFDQFIKRELGCKAYVRYVDDFVLFSNDKPTLWRWKEALEARLTRLRLKIHPGGQPRPVKEGFPFLGFIVYPDKRRLTIIENYACCCDLTRKEIFHLNRSQPAYKDGSTMPAMEILSGCVKRFWVIAW